MKFFRIIRNLKCEDVQKDLTIFYNIDLIKRITYEKQTNLITIIFFNGEYDTFNLDENLKIQFEKMGFNLNEREL